MHSSILLAIWAFVSFIIYKIISSFLDSRRHAAAARQLGCQPPHRIASIDPLGLQNVFKIVKADKEQRIPQYLKGRVDDASAEKGRPVSTFYQHLMGARNYFTMEPKNIQAILATQFKDFGLGERRNGNFSPLLGWGIFSTDGKEWEHARALLRPQFARDQVSDLELEESHVQDMMRVIPANKDGWTDIIDLQPLFFRLTIDSATEFLFGESVDSQLSLLPDYVSSKAPMTVSEHEFAVSFDAAQNTIAKASRLGEGYWLVYDKTFKEHCNRCHTFIDHYVQLALSKEKTSTQTTSHGKPRYVFLDALVESTRNPIELRSHLISILLAGRDTTASLLSYVFMLFIQHPDVYAKLRAIIQEEFGTYRNSKPLTFSNLKGCNYLQWVINETLRLYPVVPLNGRRALRDTTLPTGGGPDGTAPIYVRKGEQVDYSVYIMHRRKDLWGQDADEFKPDRWDGRKSGWEYLPFNGGPRICIGQQFALTEAGYVIVRLVQRYEKMEGIGNTWEDKERGGVGFVRHALSLTERPSDGVRVRMKEARD
ncbi:cytochrome P450 52A12 [Cucurbitaria berberidis CBS 394.84]|uniref:Cytochrome P450 52A12 n=1 Tax=Cucurbitaria berberidis CBS 394.84 TaxID=1168544 RepID=A0A9P4GF15_9PLEO|nr:cytochrome P450 52A12 [Cucurbitaria berberidis CBS 394.84]KAF1843985.1 cytochrome P450 52A12 [Cucurbitaria berberidis CBS 394.84]